MIYPFPLPGTQKNKRTNRLVADLRKLFQQYRNLIMVKSEAIIVWEAQTGL